MSTTETPPGRKVAYTLDEVAALLGVHRDTVGKLVRAGKLRVARIGWRTVRVRHEAVVDFLRSLEDTGGVSRASGTDKETLPVKGGVGQPKQIRKVVMGRRN